MPSLKKEEVGPVACTDAVLLAPEEIHKHVNAPIKADDEKTKTDRSRLRRKKKVYFSSSPIEDHRSSHELRFMLKW